MAQVVGSAEIRLEPSTTGFMERLRSQLQSDLRGATSGQDQKVDIPVDADLTKAKTAMAAFRAEQERNAIKLRIDVDENQLRQLREAFGGSVAGQGNAGGFEQLTAQVDRLTASLSKATAGAGTFGQTGETAARRVTTALTETEVLQARVTQATDKLAAAQLKEEAASQRVFAAQQKGEAQLRALERAVADLEKAEATLDRQQRIGLASSEALEESVAKVSRARQAVAERTAAVSAAEATLTGEAIKHREAENRLTDAENALGESMARLIPQEQQLAAGRRETAETSTRLQGLERELATARQTAEGDARRLARAEQELENGRTNGRTGAQRLSELEANVSRARESSAGSSGRLTRAERDLSRAHTEHETALGRLRRAQSDVDSSVERGSGLFRTFGSVMDSVRSSTDGVGVGVRGLVPSLTSLGSGLLGLIANLGQFAAVAGAVTYAVGGIGAALLTLPALATTGAAAFGVLKIGFEGFGDAIKDAKTPEELKKQKEALDKLEPSAKAAALVINNELRPAFDKVKKTVQENLFKDVDILLKSMAATTMPALERGLGKVATSMNTFGRSLVALVTGEEGAKRLERALNSASLVIDTMTPGVGRLVRAFLDFAGIESIARNLGGIISDLGTNVQVFLDRMRTTGEAERAVSALRTVVDALGKGFFDALQGAIGFFTNATPGVSNLAGVVGGLAQKILPSLGSAFGGAADGAAALLRSIPQSTIDAIKTAFQDLGTKLRDLGNQPQVQELFRQLAAQLPAIIGFVGSLADGFVKVVGAINDLNYANAKVKEFLGTTTEFDRAVINSKEAADKAKGAFQDLGAGAQQGAQGVGNAAPTAQQGAERIVNGIKIPLDKLPGTTQAQLDKLTPIMKDTLAKAVQAGGTEVDHLPGDIKRALEPTGPAVTQGLAPAAPAAQQGAERIVNGIKVPLDKLPGITQQQIDALTPPLKDGLAKAVQSGTTEMGKLPPDLQKALQPAAPAVTTGMAPAAEAAKTGTTQVIANVDFGPIVGKARETFGRVPEAVQQGIDRAVQVTQQGGTRIVQALKLTGLEAAVKRDVDRVPVAVKAAMDRAVTTATTASQQVINAANFAGIAQSAETEFPRIPTAVQTNMQLAVTNAQTTGQQLLQGQQQLYQQIVQLTQQSWQQLVQIHQQGGQQTLQIDQQVAQQIQQIFLALGPALQQAGYNMMIMLAQGIQQGGQVAIQAAQQVAQQIQGLFPQSPAKWGPLSGSGDPAQLGRNTMTRTAEGITAGSDAVAKAAADAASKVAGQLGGGVSIPARATSSGVVSSSGRSGDDALLRRALAAATKAAAAGSAASPAAAGSGSSSSEQAAPASGQTPEETYNATKAAVQDAMAGLKVQVGPGFIEYVSDGQRRNARRRGDRTSR